MGDQILLGLTKACVIAIALWGASFAWLAWGPQSNGMHRTILAAAITATLVTCTRQHALERDVALRLGLWTGKAQERRAWEARTRAHG